MDPKLDTMEKYLGLASSCSLTPAQIADSETIRHKGYDNGIKVQFKRATMFAGAGEMKMFEKCLEKAQSYQIRRGSKPDQHDEQLKEVVVNGYTNKCILLLSSAQSY